MGALSRTEQDAVERAQGADMLVQVETWAAVNSGSRHMAGLQHMAGLLADAYSALPGEVRLVAHDGMVYIELGRAGFYECRWYPPARLEPVVTDHTNPNDDEPY